MNKILIVGAGPVGLVMAAELARRGIECRVIDKLNEPLPYCRAMGVTPRTLEVFDDMGIVREIIDAGILVTGRRISVAGNPSKDIVQGLSDLPYEGICIPQPETERILTAHLKNFGIVVERGVMLTSMKQSDGIVSTILAHADGTNEEAIFQYVIGCDGAHSAVRHQAGILFEGEMMPYDFLLADVHIDWSLPRGMTFQSIYPVEGAAPDFFIAIPLPEPNRYRITTLAPGSPDTDKAGTDHGIQSELPPPALEQFQEIANRLVNEPVQLSNMKWSSTFRISTRIADRYREGNVFLAGDAAHIHPPTGGQGMNTGMQDAYNLAWKLALVIKKLANENLLDSYNAERREEGLDVIKRTMQASVNLGHATAKPDRLADTQILISYRNSPWIVNDKIAGNDPGGLQAGDRAPDCGGLRRQGIGSPFRLFDLLRGTEHVLLIKGQEDLQDSFPAITEFITTLQTGSGKNFGANLRIIVIGNNPAAISPAPGITVAYDDGHIFNSIYTSQGDTVWLIRPDGYLGWCGGNVQDPGLKDYLRKCFVAV